MTTWDPGDDSDHAGSALQRAVEQATEGTPYTVVPTNLGFNVELDLGERQWRDVFGRAGLRRMYRWEVTEKKSKYTINDVEVAVRWVAGVPGIGMSASGQAGRIFSFSRENIWAAGPDGHVRPVAEYRFNSREGRDVIRLAAKQLGLKEGLPTVLFWANVAIAVSGGIPALAFLSDWLLQR
jgi:hypothetical protein